MKNAIFPFPDNSTCDISGRKLTIELSAFAKVTGGTTLIFLENNGIIARGADPRYAENFNGEGGGLNLQVGNSDSKALHVSF